MPNNDQSTYKQIRVVMLAISLPFIMAAGPIVGFLLGSHIGAFWGHGLAGQRIGLLFGAAASVQQTVLVVRRILRESNDSGK